MNSQAPEIRLIEAISEISNALDHFFSDAEEKLHVMASIEVDRVCDFEVPLFKAIDQLSVWIDESLATRMESLDSLCKAIGHPEPKVNLARLMYELAAGLYEGEAAEIPMLNALESQDGLSAHIGAHHPCALVRAAALWNPALSPVTLRLLLDDPDEIVRGVAKGIEQRSEFESEEDSSEFSDIISYSCCGGSRRVDGTNSLEIFFAEQGLRLPRLPLNIGTVIEYHRGFWATAPWPSPWEDYWYLGRDDETLDWGTLNYFEYEPETQFAVTIAGHGVNSYGIHFRLVWKSLRLLVQIGWAGAYMDDAEQVKRWNRAMDQVDEILRLVEHSSDSDIPVVIGISEFRGNYVWGLHFDSDSSENSSHSVDEILAALHHRYEGNRYPGTAL